MAVIGEWGKMEKTPKKREKSMHPCIGLLFF